MLSFQVLYAQEGRLENVNIIETCAKRDKSPKAGTPPHASLVAKLQNMGI